MDADARQQRRTVAAPRRMPRFAIALGLSLCTALIMALQGVVLTHLAELERGEIRAFLFSEEVRFMEAQLPPAQHPQAQVALLDGAARLYRVPLGGPRDTLPAAVRALPQRHADQAIVAWNGKQWRSNQLHRNGYAYYLLYDIAHIEDDVEDLITVVVIAGSVIAGILGFWLSCALIGQVRRSHADLRDRLISVASAPEFTDTDLVPEVQSLAQAIAFYRSRHESLLERERAFTSRVGHELRTPLTAIRTSAEMLAEDPTLAAHAQARAASIVDQSDRIERITASLLALARDLNQAPAQWLLLRDVVDDIAAPVLPRLREKGIAFVIDIDADVALELPLSFLEIALGNLLSNAVRYSDGGTIRVVWDAPWLEVHDQGRGLADIDTAHVFDSFYRGRNVPTDGYGLGLAIVADIAAKLGWTCELRAATGGGTIARLKFSVSGDA